MGSLVDPVASLLPPELVEKIFRLCVPTGHTHLPLTEVLLGCRDGSGHNTTTEAPVLLCRVSKDWKDFVYSCPSLWANICAHSRPAFGNLDSLNAWLARSKSFPLTVCLNLIFTNDADAFTTLFTHSARIRSLRLINTVGGDVSSDFTSALPFTQLEAFSIQSPAIMTHYPNLLKTVSPILLSAPRLHDVKWAFDECPSPLLTIGSQIKKLDLTSFQTTSEISDILRAFPHLVELSVNQHSWITEPTPRRNQDVVVLADLKTLHTSQFAMPGFVAPVLRSFGFNGHDGHLPNLISFLRHSPHLDDVTLSLQLDPRADLTELLSSIQSISQLEINFGTFNPSAITHQTLAALTYAQGDQNICMLPNLQRLELNGSHPWLPGQPLFRIQEDLVMSMLESRCRAPLSSRSADPRPHSPSSLESFVLNKSGTVKPDTMLRLEPLRERGLVLHVADPTPYPLNPPPNLPRSTDRYTYSVHPLFTS
ncbi:hypothetical protein BV22DRAFT_10352 [Leucogyrophana mollusca]|uniref:Uncharacterized protein n=1 Tax=Leucogyrophana mollusca TaxID=85980 RepID=A0ACB8C0C7_9AGAM|nr:hypothetical protein BV22DRAFT_10352 [Leucogyrophana mollusca]